MAGPWFSRHMRVWHTPSAHVFYYTPGISKQTHVFTQTPITHELLIMTISIHYKQIENTYWTNFITLLWLFWPQVWGSGWSICKKTVCPEAISHHQHQSGCRGCNRSRLGCHAMDQGRSEVDVKDREKEDHMDCQSNQEEGDHPHFDCHYHSGSVWGSLSCRRENFTYQKMKKMWGQPSKIRAHNYMSLHSRLQS